MAKTLTMMFAILFLAGLALLATWPLTWDQLADSGTRWTNHALGGHVGQLWSTTEIWNEISAKKCLPIKVYVCAPKDRRVMSPDLVTAIDTPNFVAKVLCPYATEGTPDMHIGILLNVDEVGTTSGAKVVITGYAASWNRYWLPSMTRDNCMFSSLTQ